MNHCQGQYDLQRLGRHSLFQRPGDSSGLFKQFYRFVEFGFFVKHVRLVDSLGQGRNGIIGRFCA